MRPISGKAFAKAIERHGWVLQRVQGSHYIYKKPGSEVRLSVPLHGNRLLKIGLMRHLATMAALREDDLR